MPHPYQIWDVFTDMPFTGNPLAVVFDTDGLSDVAMQFVVAEFNLAETIFLAAPCDPANTHKARIFTPVHEMPFAGHPTVGASIAVAAARAADGPVTLELPAGVVRCDVHGRRATIVAPKRPACLAGTPASATMALLMQIGPDAVGVGAMSPARATSDPHFTILPVRDTNVLATLSPGAQTLAALGKGSPTFMPLRRPQRGMTPTTACACSRRSAASPKTPPRAPPRLHSQLFGPRPLSPLTAAIAFGSCKAWRWAVRPALLSRSLSRIAR